MIRYLDNSYKATGNHYIIDNEKYIRVSSIIKKDFIFNSEFDNYRQTQAMFDGIRRHKDIEYFINNEHSNINNFNDIAVYIDFLKKYNIDISSAIAEQRFCFKNDKFKYAGTIDLITKDCVIDWKSKHSNNSYKEQLALYCYATENKKGYLVYTTGQVEIIEEEFIINTYQKYHKAYNDFMNDNTSNYKLNELKLDLNVINNQILKLQQDKQKIEAEIAIYNNDILEW